MAAFVSNHGRILCLAKFQVIHKCSLQTTAPLLFETTKSKGKQKHSITVAVYNKKMRKLQKALRGAEKTERILKPIDERELPVQIKNEIAEGTRQREKITYSSDQLETQILLEKDWSRYKTKQAVAENRLLKNIIKSQEKALQKLREESEDLYQRALEKDDNYLPYIYKGPLYTPPIPGYFAEDGSYIDRTNYFLETPDELSVLDKFLKKDFKR
ncbi:39S ribosomal protein L40 [Mactra antiquata]